MSGKSRILLMAGPTASGKSACALKVAQTHDGIIVNADSMQVYENLRILTARPGKREEVLVPHKLYGFVGAGEAFSTGKWLEAVTKLLAKYRDCGQLLIFTGGTGLYFKALTEGLSQVPEIPADIRIHWRDRLALEGAEALHQILQENDAKLAAKLEPADGQRIVRGLEVFEATGEPLSVWHERPGQSVLEGWTVDRLVLLPQRELLYERCNARFDQMVDQGALDEVAQLMALNVAPDLPVMKALGVAPIIEHLNGTLSLQEAGDLAKRDTRRYAKRQMTWFRGQMKDWPTCDPMEGMDEVLACLEI